MKKKIIIGLSIFSILFLIGGVYIIINIERATSTLDTLIMLHQVEILREHLLIQIKRVQGDLTLKNTRYAKGIDTIVKDVRNMERVADACFQCHHSESVVERLKDLNNHIKEYQNTLSRVFTIRANTDRLEMEEDAAFESGNELISHVNRMIALTSSRLEQKTQATLKEIRNIKGILFVLVALGPLMTIALAFLLIRGFTRPVNTLLDATRRLKQGDLDFRITGLKDEFGEVAASFNDMTDSLKGHMQRIRDSEERYRTLFESAGDAIFIVDAGGENFGRIVAANHSAAEMHGYSVGELLSKNITELCTCRPAEVEGMVKRILGGERVTVEMTHRRKDGSVFPVDMFASLFEFGGRRYILMYDRDITERKMMEGLLIRTKQDWEETFDSITDLITIHDEGFNIIRANRAARRALRLSDDGLENQRIKCYNFYHGEEHPPERCKVCETMISDAPVTFEVFEPHLNRFIETRIIPRYDENHQLIGSIHICRDITERKQTEEMLQRTEQMRIAGEIAAGLAHEIKNPLAGIKVSMEVLQSELELSEEDKDVFLKVIDEVKRIEVLMKDLLNFARPPKPKFEQINVNDVLERTLALSLKHPSFSSNNSKTVHVSKGLGKNLPGIIADPLQLQQVFLNLFLNAVDAMPEGGNLIINTSHNAEADSLQIDIADTGKGISEDVMDKLFKPFFTTKPKGTGLGLAITRRLVEQHGGTINIKNNSDKGVVFTIILPAAQSEVPA